MPWGRIVVTLIQRSHPQHSWSGGLSTPLPMVTIAGPWQPGMASWWYSSLSPGRGIADGEVVFQENFSVKSFCGLPTTVTPFFHFPK